MKRKLFIVWFVALLLLAAHVGGMAASLWDDLIPQGEKKVGNIPVEYNQYPLSHYQLDLYLEQRSFWELDEELSDTGHYFLHQITNMFWQVNVEFSKAVIWVMEEALKLDLVKEIGQSVGEGVQTLAGFDGRNLTDRGFYGLFFPLMIVILGGWVGWKALAEGNEDAAVRGLIHAFVVIFASFTFFYFVKDFSNEANRVSGEISKGFMALASNTFQPGMSLSGEEATVQAGNNLWDLMVMTPYKLLEFGTTDVDQKRVDAVLSQPPEKRGAVIEKEMENKNPMITTKSSGTRLGFVLMVLVLNLIVACIILLIAAGMPFYQLYFLFLLMLAPIALTWAIVPAWRDALEKWISEVLGALLMKVALGMLLAIFLSISGALYQFSMEKGYFLSMLLQLVLLGLVIWKRKNIFQLVTMPAVMTTGYGNQSGNLLDTIHKVFGIFDVVRGRRGRRGEKPEPRRHKKKPKRAGEPSTSSAASEYIPTYIAEEVPNEEKPDLIFEPYDDPALPHEEKPALEEMPMLVFDEPSEPEPLPELEPAPSVREEKKKPDREEAPILLVGETR